MRLNNCQARDENKLDYHRQATLFNASLKAGNIALKAIQRDEIYKKSINNFMRYKCNQKFTDTILLQTQPNRCV